MLTFISKYFAFSRFTAYALVFVIIGIVLQLNPNFMAVLLLCLGLKSLVPYNALVEKCSSRHKVILNIFFWIYPPIATWTQWMIHFDIIPYSWRYLNTFEHGFTSCAVTIFLFPIFYQYTSALGKYMMVLFLFGVMMTLGIGNEIAELAYRVYIGNTGQSYFAAYYQDTMYDLVLNIVGTLTAIGMVWRSIGRETKKNQSV